MNFIWIPPLPFRGVVWFKKENILPHVGWNYDDSFITFPSNGVVCGGWIWAIYKWKLFWHVFIVYANSEAIAVEVTFERRIEVRTLRKMKIFGTTAKKSILFLIKFVLVAKLMDWNVAKIDGKFFRGGACKENFFKFSVLFPAFLPFNAPFWGIFCNLNLFEEYLFNLCWIFNFWFFSPILATLKK